MERVPAGESLWLDTQTVSDIFAAIIARVVVPDSAVLNGIYVDPIALCKSLQAGGEADSREK